MKLVKQLVSQPTSLQSLSKTISLVQNLTKSHLQGMRMMDATLEQETIVFLLIRQLFMENVLQLGGVKEAILANQIKSTADFLKFTQLQLSASFESMIDGLRR